MPDFALSSRVEQVSGAPQLPAVRILVLALAFFASSLVGLEFYGRNKGVRATVPETFGLWYFWRQQVYPRDGKVIVFAGTSRISAGISLATMRECLPSYRVVQLGILGPVSCIGLLQDLANDSAFRGIVVCELDAPLLQRSEWDGHRSFRTYRPPTIPALVDVVIKARLQERLVSLNEKLTLEKLFSALLSVPVKAEAASSSRFFRTFSREVCWDFGVPHAEQFQKTLQSASADDARLANSNWRTLAKDAQEIDAMVQRLRSRGGDVVFLRAPSTGTRWLREEESYPRTDNWDHFARLTSAPCVHFQDVPEMRALVCPDDSHLDYRDSPQFTRALLSKLLFLTNAKQYAPKMVVLQTAISALGYPQQTDVMGPKWRLAKKECLKGKSTVTGLFGHLARSRG
jgi:hypothetical protein